MSVKAKGIFFSTSETAAAAFADFFRALSNYAAVAIEIVQPGAPVAIEDCEFALIDVSLGEEGVRIADELPETVHCVFVAPEPADLLTGDSAEFMRSLCGRGNLLVASSLPAAEWQRLAPLVATPGRTRGVTDCAGGNRFVAIHKLQSLNDIGWLLDALHLFMTIRTSAAPTRFTEVRQAVTGLAGEALERARASGQARPTVALQIVPDREAFAFSLRFPTAGLDAAHLAEDITLGKLMRWHIAWQACDLFQILHYPAHEEVEVRAVIHSGTKVAGFVTKTLLYSSFGADANPQDLLTPAEGVAFRTIESLLDELPEDRLHSALAPAQATQQSEADSALAKLMHRKSELVQQLAHRIEQEQQNAQDRQRKVGELLTEAKGALETSRRELAQAKNRIKILERQIAESKPVDGARSEEAEKQLNEINNSLRAINHEKATSEEKLALSLKKIEILEQKYAKAVHELQAKEKEISTAKTVALKLSKELENAQSALKAQSQAAPVQVGNEEYEKKIKALSAKLYELTQKEAEAQTLVKKMSLKLEQSEIGKKVGNKENDGKMKQLEKQVEQGKAKEKELLKKIEELNALLKKAKTGKAA